MSEVDPVEPTEPLFRSELEFWRDREVELARLPGREVLGVRVVDGVRLDYVEVEDNKLIELLVTYIGRV